MNDFLTVKSAVVCSPDSDSLAQFGIQSVVVEKHLIPANIRRRASLTTKMAVTAGIQACQQAKKKSGQLPSIFASVGGEIQVTDALCRELPDRDFVLSPTRFHNSVHNTTAGYWSILQNNAQSSTAISGIGDTFAMALLEAWCQLQQEPGDILLVCYDEYWPDYLAPPMGKIAIATALVLSSTDTENALLMIGQPKISDRALYLSPDLLGYIKDTPAAAVIPLLQAIRCSTKTAISLNCGQPHWISETGNRS